MKLFLRRPSSKKIIKLVSARQHQPVTYSDVSATRSWHVESFTEQPNRQVVADDLWLFRRANIGVGSDVYQTGVRWLRTGKCFDLNWVDCYQLRKFETGDTFGLVARAGLLWVANFCQVVYVEESNIEGRTSMTSLGIGTLVDHVAIGEERLSIRWDHETNQVDLLIGSFSRPQGLLPRLFSRYLRNSQNRFAVDTINNLKKLASNAFVSTDGLHSASKCER